MLSPHWPLHCKGGQVSPTKANSTLSERGLLGIFLNERLPLLCRSLPPEDALEGRSRCSRRSCCFLRALFLEWSFPEQSLPRPVSLSASSLKPSLSQPLSTTLLILLRDLSLLFPGLPPRSAPRFLNIPGCSLHLLFVLHTVTLSPKGGISRGLQLLPRCVLLTLQPLPPSYTFFLKVTIVSTSPRAPPAQTQKDTGPSQRCSCRLHLHRGPQPTPPPGSLLPGPSSSSPAQSNQRATVIPPPAAAAAAKSFRSCPTLCDPMDCSPLGSSFHGIFQARVLEWGAIAFSAFHLLVILNSSPSAGLSTSQQLDYNTSCVCIKSLQSCPTL